ncbi:hypothetical protein N7540_000140 [Penicillium herquei]|nr:hypothetical protein N7540_000140 [Penicillium herquei]
MKPEYETILQCEYFDWSEEIGESTKLTNKKNMEVCPIEPEFHHHSQMSRNIIENSQGIISSEVGDSDFSDDAETTEDDMDQLLNDGVVDNVDASDDTTESDATDWLDEDTFWVGSEEIKMTNTNESGMAVQNRIESDPSLEWIDGTIDAEFSWRKFCTETDHEIHHYNPLRQPVYEPSGASAAKFLASILSTKKIICPLPKIIWWHQS